MKKYLFGFSLCAILSLICACGSRTSSDSNKENEEYLTLTPQTTKISGPLGLAYTIVDRSYKIKREDDFKKINVEIELTDASQLPQNFSYMSVGTAKDKGDSNYEMLADFRIDFLDEEGDIIETKEAEGKFDHLLRLSQGDKGTISFYLPYRNWEDIRQFRITSDYYPNNVKVEEVEEVKEVSDFDYSDEDFDKAMDQATKAVETTTKMMKDMFDLIR